MASPAITPDETPSPTEHPESDGRRSISSAMSASRNEAWLTRNMRPYAAGVEHGGDEDLAHDHAARRPIGGERGGVGASGREMMARGRDNGPLSLAGGAAERAAAGCLQRPLPTTTTSPTVPCRSRRI